MDEGAAPSGQILSNTKDLSRWLQIQLGTVKLPDLYAKVIEQSHIPNEKSKVNETAHYAAGWYVNDEDGSIYHPGGNPNYSSCVIADIKNQNAACVLTNINAAANTNDIANNLIRMLRGENNIQYSLDVWNIMDMCFSFVIVLSYIYLFIGIGFIYVKRGEIKKPRKFWPIISGIFVLSACVCLVVFPTTFSYSWPIIFIWAPPTILMGILNLIIVPAVLFILQITMRNRSHRKANFK